MEDIEVEIIHEYGLDLYKFFIHMPPMKVVIICNNLTISSFEVAV
jgi:hypothetical protein